MSSLILSCARLKLPTAKFDEESRRNLVRNYLKKMQADHSKLVLLDKFGKIDLRFKEGEPIDAESILDKAFAPATVKRFMALTEQ